LGPSQPAGSGSLSLTGTRGPTLALLAEAVGASASSRAATKIDASTERFNIVTPLPVL
jgi:hypothetical protein